MKDTIYLAGPMRGRPKFNYPLFDRVAAGLRHLGHKVINPAEQDSDELRQVALDSETGNFDEIDAVETYGAIMGRDVQLIIDEVDSIALLPAWVESTGARMEAAVARILGKDVYEVDEDTLELTEIDTCSVCGTHDEIQEQAGEE